jgi:hypothetical protein
MSPTPRPSHGTRHSDASRIRRTALAVLLGSGVVAAQSATPPHTPPQGAVSSGAAAAAQAARAAPVVDAVVREARAQVDCGARREPPPREVRGS